jgi:hypothetical protein
MAAMNHREPSPSGTASFIVGRLFFQAISLFTSDLLSIESTLPLRFAHGDSLAEPSHHA